jgi:hypothetical protein
MYAIAVFVAGFFSALHAQTIVINPGYCPHTVINDCPDRFYPSPVVVTTPAHINAQVSQFYQNYIPVSGFSSGYQAMPNYRQIRHDSSYGTFPSY